MIEPSWLHLLGRADVPVKSLRPVWKHSAALGKYQAYILDYERMETGSAAVVLAALSFYYRVPPEEAERRLLEGIPLNVSDVEPIQ